MDKKRIHSMLETMTQWVESEINSKGKEQVCTEELGKAIDMIKDLAEAEKAVWEKCYYEKVTEAMEEEKEELEQWKKSDRMGYDRWRYSSGRFAPKGNGHETSMSTATGRSGYIPIDDGPWPDDTWSTTSKRLIGPHVRYGYDGGRPNRMDNQSNDSGIRRDGATSRSGYTPEENPDEYLNETIGTMKEMFMEAQPDLQDRMIDQFRKMCRDFGLQV